MCGVVLEGGTLTSSAGLVRAAACTAPSFGVARGTRWFGEGSVVGTLLGPEGADLLSGRVAGGWVGCLGSGPFRFSYRPCLLREGWGLAGAGERWLVVR